MTILYHFRTQGTGAEGVHIAGIASAFEQLGHRVVFSSPTGIDPRASAGANPFGTARRSLLARLAARAPRIVFELLEIAYNAVAAWRNLRLILRERPALIYERHAFFLFSTAMLARLLRVPLVVEVNELVGDERIRPDPLLAVFARAADRITFSLASRIVVVSPHLKRRIESLGVPGARVLVLPNAVTTESLDAPADGAAMRARYGLQDAVVIGFVGWFVAWHRLDRLVEEFAALAGGEPRLRLMLVGDGTLKPALEGLAARLGIATRIIWTDSVPHAEVAAHIAAMDICVVPHSNEYRSPIKLFEYMARARAVVAPRVEPIAMVLRHGENGLLFDAENADDLRAQLARLAGDAALRERLGAAAKRDVREQHTWLMNAQRVLGRSR